MKTVKQIIDEIRADIEIRPTPLDEQLDELLKSYEKEIDELSNTLNDTCENLAWYINERQRLLKVIEYSKPNEGLQRTIRKALERPYGEWIPCSERLPSYSERIVLATVVRRDKTWNNDPYHRLVTYTNGKWYPIPQSINLVPCRMATIEQSDGGQAEVIAWMPLPKLYKEEGEEE